jgi:hypothetical protein
MRQYCLSINIHSNDPELLDRLMLTLETPDGDMSALDRVQIRTSNAELRTIERNDGTELEKGVALEQWFLPEGI